MATNLCYGGGGLGLRFLPPRLRRLLLCHFHKRFQPGPTFAVTLERIRASPGPACSLFRAPKALPGLCSVTQGSKPRPELWESGATLEHLQTVHRHSDLTPQGATGVHTLQMLLPLRWILKINLPGQGEAFSTKKARLAMGGCIHALQLRTHILHCESLGRSPYAKLRQPRSC